MKRFATVLYIALLLLSLPFLKAGAQTAPDIVINEYFNESTFTQEWTELVVTRDISSMAGFVFTDNNVGQITWQGGVTFKNIPLWQNVKEGTIIIIWHRNNSSMIRDISAADGYIEVSRDDRTVFDEFLSATGSDYDEVALNIAEGGDILQIRRGANSTTSIHALAHKTLPGNSFILITSYKINTPEDCPNGAGNAVLPGRTIADYTGAGKAQIVTSSNITRGLPNKNTQYPLNNYQFWEELREPEWTTANSITYQYSPTGITLNWTPLANASNVEGYVILRATSFPSLPPLDGYIFKKGVAILGFPSIEVVDTIPATSSTYTENFTASFKLECGEFAEYRLYPYRYGKDDQNKDNTVVPFSARGRSYNETDFAKVTVSRPAFPAPPQVTVLGGGTFFVFCEGQSIALTAIPDNAASYQWLKDGVVIPGATNKIYVTTIPGKYSVRAYNTEGCADQSAEVTVTKSTIGATFTDDVKACETTLTALPAGSDYTYQWLNQSNTVITGATQNTYLPDQAGTYSVIVTDNSGCTDTSDARFINVNSPNLTFQVNGIPSNITTIDFGTLGECESSKKIVLTVSTLSSLPILVELTAPTGYRAQPTSFKLNSQSAQDVDLYFEPTAPGTNNATLRIKSECDQLETPVNLLGTKTQGGVAAIASAVEYPVTISCEPQKITQTVKIVNGGNTDVSFLQPTVAAPFTVIAPAFPKPVAPNDTLTITVEYTSTTGLSSKILNVPYISTVCTSSVNVSLIANTIQPSITSTVAEVDFKALEGCTREKDTTIDVTNPTDYPLVIPVQQLDANFSITQAISLGAKETKSVTLRFTPTAPGQIASTVLLKADKCPDVANIELLLKGNSGAPSIQSVPEYETITNCSAINFKTVQSSITTTSPAVIEDIIIPAGFTISGINIGQSVKGIVPFDITFAPAADGVYDDSLLVQFAGCPQKEKVLLKGRKTTLKFAFKEAEIDFGTVTPNTTVPTQSATIVNTGVDSVTVNKIDPPAPFKIVSTSLPLPARLAPGQEITVVFEYAPVQENTDSYSAAFEACFGQQTILLKGIAQYPAGTGKALVSLPVLRGAPGSIIEIPITIANEANSFALEKAAVRQISIQFSYDPMLLMPQSVRTGDAAIGFDQASVTEITPGVAEVVLKTSGSSVITSGTVAIVQAKVLLGANASTNIVFSKITPLGNNALIFTQKNGEFILDDSCSAGKRVGSISGQFLLMVNGKMPVSDDKAEITFETNTDEMLALELYNSFGQRVRTIFKGTAKAGRYINEVSLKDLSDGVYHIVMQNSTNNATAKLVIVR
ncbi:MAG: choice-of-anchor D domain-containing protein [Bacteroidota bacterium]